jgi:hypothetical protein
MLRGVTLHASLLLLSLSCAPRLTGLRSAHRGLDNFENTRVVDLGFRVARNL